MQRIRLALVAAASLLLFPAGRAQAGPIFDYSTTVAAATSPVLPDPTAAMVNVSIGDPGSLRFTTNSRARVNAGLSGGADINFGQIEFLPSVGGDGAEHPYSVYFAYKVKLTAYSETKFITLTGKIDGGASSDGLDSGIFGDISLFSFSANPSVQLGAYIFTLVVKSATGPGSSMDLGALQINVRAAAAVPEPSSIALLGVSAVAGLSLVARRRRIV